jgi:hypothetical protein
MNSETVALHCYINDLVLTLNRLAPPLTSSSEEGYSECSDVTIVLYDDQHGGHCMLEMWQDRLEQRKSPTSPISPMTEEILKGLPQHTQQSFLDRRKRRWEERSGSSSGKTNPYGNKNDDDGTYDNNKCDYSEQNYHDGQATLRMCDIPIGSPIRRRTGWATSLGMPSEPSRFVSPLPVRYRSDSDDDSCEEDEHRKHDKLKDRIGPNILPTISIFSPKKSITTGKFPHAA